MIEAEPDNKQHRVQEPFQELELAMNDFFTNDELNNELCMVTGEDLCKVIDTCMFLAEQLNEQRIQAIALGKKIGKNYSKMKQKHDQVAEEVKRLEEEKNAGFEEQFNNEMIVEQNATLTASNIELTARNKQLNELVQKLQIEVEQKTKKMKDMTTDLMIEKT